MYVLCIWGVTNISGVPIKHALSINMSGTSFPCTGAFNMRLNGFKKPPCDHYARPFWSAVPHDENSGLHDICINAQAQHVIQLDYLRSMFEAYVNTPKFCLPFFSSLCHREGSVNTVSIAEKEILSFLKAFNASGHLNNTLLIVMGDHGPRIGGFRATLQGKLEERLPFLSLVVPEWFKIRYPEIARHLRSNTRRIITPLDIYATFTHLLKYPKDPSQSKLTSGLSLFSRIPPNRTCAQAQIPEYFCPCVTWKPISVNHAHSKTSAQAAVDHINTLLGQTTPIKEFCSELQLHKVLSVVQEMPNQKVQLLRRIKNGDGLGIGEPQFYTKNRIEECSYQVQFQTIPGFGIFEASVKLVKNQFVVHAGISRINSYGSQPDCIQRTHPYLRKYCHCKKSH